MTTADLQSTSSFDESASRQTWQQLRDRLRPGQQRLADWHGGPLAVSAVPGAGKSTGMAIATAILLAKRHIVRQQINAGQEISPEDAWLEAFTPQRQLVLVTFTRSAAANLKLKIRQYLRELSIPATGFAVYTLHGLALSIANRHPDLSGLDLDQSTLVSPNQSHRLLKTSVEQWISGHPQLYQTLLEGQQFDGEETERLRRQSVLRTEVLPELAQTVIREAKSSGLSAQALAELSQTATQVNTGEGRDYNVLAIAAGLYEQYEILLRQRSFIDYDDMILAALRVLENETAKHLWRSQIFAVFEDEAQDSSPLQTRLIEQLAADPDDPALPLNLIRVGDPNQAINSTFTPADPIFFREFCEDCAAQGQLAEMDQAGRSTFSVIQAANRMLNWVNQQAQTPRGRSPHHPELSTPVLPFRSQQIQPVSPNDPQPDANPTPEGAGVEIHRPTDTYQTVEWIARRMGAIAQANPDVRAAILVRENRQGRFITDLLRRPGRYGVTTNLEDYGLGILDVGERDRQSHIPEEMLMILQFLDRPHSPDYLKAMLKVLSDRRLIPSQDLNRLTSAPEQFLYPSPLADDATDPDPVADQARRFCTGLLRARLELPPYQVIPFLALALQYEQSELATADKLAERLSRQMQMGVSIDGLISALTELVNSENFDPVDTEEDAEARYTRPGQVTIITMHKAKGLDWDVVFLPFLHESVIPGKVWLPPQTQFLGEFNLVEVARAQIRAHLHGESRIPDNLTAWQQASVLKRNEEFRLLYVAMTRAKRLLWMSAAQRAPFTWSKPDNLQEQSPCPVLAALQPPPS